MLDVSSLFEEMDGPSSSTFEGVWSDHAEMKRWLPSVFDAILAMPAHSIEPIDVPPYRFRHDATDLYSVSFLSFFDLQPEGAAITSQDFGEIFCNAFLDYLAGGDGAEDLFVLWASRVLLFASERNEHLYIASPDFIQNHLSFHAKTIPYLLNWAKTTVHGSSHSSISSLGLFLHFS